MAGLYLYQSWLPVKQKPHFHNLAWHRIFNFTRGRTHVIAVTHHWLYFTFSTSAKLYLCWLLMGHHWHFEAASNILSYKSIGMWPVPSDSTLLAASGCTLQASILITSSVIALGCQKFIEIQRNSTESPNNFFSSLKQCIVGQPEPHHGEKWPIR